MVFYVVLQLRNAYAAWQYKSHRYYFAAAISAHAQQNFIVLPGDQIEAYIRQQPLQIAPSALANCDSGGYVLIRYAQLNLGLGLLAWPKDGQPASLKLSSLFPQSWQGGQ